MYSLRFIGVMFGLALIIIAIRAIVKRVITERQSLFWIFSGLIIAVGCAFPWITWGIADYFGVEYAPTIIFMVAIGLLVFGLFYCFQKLAKLSRQVRDLAISASLYKQMLEEIQGNKQLPEAEKQAEEIGKEQ